MEVAAASRGRCDASDMVELESAPPMSQASARLFPNDLPRLTHAHMAAEVLRWLDSHPSLGINRSSRIYSLCQTVVSNAGRVSERGEPHYVLLEQSFKDVQELWLITRVLGDELLEPPFKEPFIRAGANDSELPEDSGDLTRGRDAQFELFVGAVGRRVGFDVSHLGEGQPDWLMSTGIRAWTVETKRAKSAKAVNRLSEKATKQIKRSLVGGVIVIDVSAIGGADQRRLVRCVSDEELADAREKMGDAILSDALPQIMKVIGDVPVGLIIFHDYVIRPAGKRRDGVEVPWGLHGLWWAYHLEAPGSSQRDRYKEFWELFGRGLPDL